MRALPFPWSFDRVVDPAPIIGSTNPKMTSFEDMGQGCRSGQKKEFEHSSTVLAMGKNHEQCMLKKVFFEIEAS